MMMERDAGSYLTTVKSHAHETPHHILVSRVFQHLPTLIAQLLGENGSPGVFGQVVVGNFQVEAVANGRVDVTHAVGGEEHDPVKGLESLQKDSHQSIAVQVEVGAGLEEDIGFVEEHDGLPPAGGPEELHQQQVKLGWVCTQVSGRYLTRSAGEQDKHDMQRRKIRKSCQST